MSIGMNLTRQFGLLSLIGILLIALVSGYLMTRFLTAKLLSREATLTAEFVDSLVGTDQLWQPFEAQRQGMPTPEFRYFFNHLIQMPDVLHANIYSADRVLLWATDTGLIGQQFARNDELDDALGGRLTYETGVSGPAADKEEHARMDDVREGLHFVEIYIPIRDQSGDRVLGVVEIYKQPRVLNQSIVEAVRLVWLIALLSAAVLYASLFWIVKRASRTIDEQNRRLVESESLSMIGETASAVAHAMRNPLASIRACAELTLKDDLEGARESARDIIDETDRLERWARDLLKFSRAGSDAEGGHCDVAVLLREALEEQRPMLERSQIEVHCDIGAGRLLVAADPVPVGQVLSNLIVNAVEAMADGGRLSLTTQSVGRGNGQIQVTVADTGGGLPEAMTGRLFKPFATTKPNGTGLGLALSKRLVQHYHGQLLLESRAGHGLTAKVILPRVEHQQ
jgi:two-component system sensor histidine kinase HydH